MRHVTVLGSTGSIGLSTLDVLRRHPERFRVHALTANRNVERLIAQCREFRPAFAAVADTEAAADLRRRMAEEGLDVEVLDSPAALSDLAAHPDTDCVVAGIVGAAGLLPTLAAAEAGKRILLANKEVLVMAGHLFMEAVARGGAELLPIDSEHNAIFQCLPSGYDRQGADSSGVRRLLLTASGGPFRTFSLQELATVTPEQACAHPNWDMGPKISVDSATMMNKGLELIEACLLFSMEPSRVDVVVHPQSIVHSMVEYTDGSVLAQLGNPDMRTPIAHALAWPLRVDAGVSPLDLLGRNLQFEPADTTRFPALALAYEAAAEGGTRCAQLNAANEVAVAAFLEGNLAFTAIAEVVEETMQRMPCTEARSIPEILDTDTRARDVAHGLILARAAF